MTTWLAKYGSRQNDQSGFRSPQCANDVLRTVTYCEWSRLTDTRRTVLYAVTVRWSSTMCCEYSACSPALALIGAMVISVTLTLVVWSRCSERTRANREPVIVRYPVRPGPTVIGRSYRCAASTIRPPLERNARTAAWNPATSRT